MSGECTHTDTIRDVTPSALGCEECLKIGSPWVHLRLCRTCGHVGCCDDSPNRHATKHFHQTRHPIIEGYDPPEGWGWCYIDEIMLDLSDRATPQNGGAVIPLVGLRLERPFLFRLDRARRQPGEGRIDLVGAMCTREKPLPSNRWPTTAPSLSSAARHG